MIFKEIIVSIPQGSEIRITVRDSGNDIEIILGEIDEHRHFCDPFAHELHDKPWSLSLFLNMAHKILSDHGGKLLLDPGGDSAIPLIMRLPMIIKV